MVVVVVVVVATAGGKGKRAGRGEDRCGRRRWLQKDREHQYRDGMTGQKGRE